jgi:hypothetical protein
MHFYYELAAHGTRGGNIESATSNGCTWPQTDVNSYLNLNGLNNGPGAACHSSVSHQFRLHPVGAAVPDLWTCLVNPHLIVMNISCNIYIIYIYTVYI